MSAWQEMSEENLRAAPILLDTGLYRASVGRSYYAVYCAITEELVKRSISYPFGWNNPAHEQMPDLVLNNTDYPQLVRRRLRSTLIVLRRARETAEYRPAASVDRATALESVRLASLAIRDL